MGPECFRPRHSSGDMYSFFYDQRGKNIAYAMQQHQLSPVFFFISDIFLCSIAPYNIEITSGNIRSTILLSFNK